MEPKSKKEEFESLKVGDVYISPGTGVAIIDGAPVFLSYGTKYKVFLDVEGKRKLAVAKVQK